MRRIVTLAVDPAEVEPEPVPAVALHRRRPAPVGAHDERVALAGLEERLDLEREVLAGVRAHEVAVDEDLGLVVDGLEADRVEAVGRDLDLRPVPADRPAERVDAAPAADPRRARHVRDADEIAAEIAVRVALVQAGVAEVALEAPQPVELGAIAGPGVDQRRRAVRREHDRAGGGVGRRGRDGDERGDEHERQRAQTRDPCSDQPTAHSSPFFVSVTKVPAPSVRRATCAGAERLAAATRRRGECSAQPGPGDGSRRRNAGFRRCGRSSGRRARRACSWGRGDADAVRADEARASSRSPTAPSRRTSSRGTPRCPRARPRGRCPSA